MSEAGQIFALLRASSAAELAKRFNSWGDGSAPAPSAGAADAGDLGSTPPTPGGSGAPLAGKGASGLVAILSPSAPADGHEPAPADPAGQALSNPLRAAASLAHLAPPRSDLARYVANSLLSGLSRGEGSGAATMGTAAALAEAGTGHAGAGQGAAGADPAGEFVAVLAALLGSSAEADLGSATARAANAGPGSAGEVGASLAAKGDQSAEQVGEKPSILVQTSATSAKEAPTLDKAAAGTIEHGQTPVDIRNPAPARAADAAQVAAFAQALTAALNAAGNGGMGTVASGIIFNAAMMPGWPFASAMAKDGAEGINPKAMLHQLAAAMEGMSPQQAAEYMAKIGGGHVLLRALRKILKELDMTRKEEVKGLLFAFLETLCTIAAGLQAAFQQIAESAALQSAVIHGEDPEDNDRPGRRRLKL